MSLARLRIARPAAALAIACVAMLGACSDATVAAAQPTAGVDAISVLGSRLLKHGVPWVPRGVQIVGMVAPDEALSGKYVAAHQHFGEPELRAAVASGADTVRFQVSEFGLDPDDPLYSPAYVQEVQNGVEMARQLGLVVIVSVQAEAPAGRSGRCALPDAGTERAWRELASMFAADPGVLFELYNEPAVAPTLAGWQEWLFGGQISQPDGTSCQAVGMQTLIDDIRGAGAGNVIVVPGLAGERTLAGMPVPTDPANPSDPQLAYGIHYPSPSAGSTRWDLDFGRFSVQAPVIVTEWDANSINNCSVETPAIGALLLDYLASKQIGIVGFAFDLPGTIIADWTYAPTTYRGFSCSIAGDGPGELLFGQFAAMRQAEAGSPLGVPLAWIFSYRQLQQLSALAPQLAQHFFDTPRTFVTGTSEPALLGLGYPAAVPTASFRSERALATTIRSHTLPPGTRAVLLYDDGSSMTPLAERQHPGRFYRQAGQLAHRAHLLLIAAPEPYLLTPDAPPAAASRAETEFLSQGIAAAAARHADVYVAGPLSLPPRPARNRAFVAAAAIQASAAHPGVELMSALASSALGAAAPRHRSPAPLDEFVLSIPLVSGYWLDPPQAAAACPGCRDLAAARWFLRELRRAGR